MADVKDWFEEYALGEEIRSPYIRITREDVLAYTRFSHDLRTVHINDPDDLSAERFVPPMYILNLGLSLLTYAPERSWLPEKLLAFLEFETIDFGEPGEPGELIYSTARVDRLVPKGSPVLGRSAGVLGYVHETRNQEDETLVTTRHTMLVARKDPER